MASAPALSPGGASTRSEFLSTLAPSRDAYRLAAAVVAVSVVFFLAAAPFAKSPLAPIGAFLPAYQSALIVNDLITAVLLFGQFGILRQRAMLVLACGYLLCALMAGAHLLSFPGLFPDGGLPGAGPQTTAWLYFLWHGAFPLLVIAYALLKERADRPVANPRLESLTGIAAVLGAALAMMTLVTAGHDALPPIMQGNKDAAAKFLVAFPVWCLCVAALFMLWRGKARSVLDLWLMVVMCSWIFDVALASVLNAGRFDLGWYTGRVYGLLAASFVLAVLLLENSMLYARLAGAHRQLGELNRELESFSYSVSHDLGRPVRAVDGYARMLEEDYSDRLDAEGRRLLQVVRAEALRMGELIRDLLAFSRLGRQAMSPTDFDTGALVREVIAALHAEGADRARIACATLPHSSGDRSLLHQVWANLLGNAIKYSAKREQPVIEIGCFGQNGMDVFYVKDNGAGFNMQYYDKLFGVFQRMHSEKDFAGTGVGLAIVQKIVNRHGGTVWAQGAVDAGATFFFSLPRSAAAARDRGGVADIPQFG